jgi:xylulokinase
MRTNGMDPNVIRAGRANLFLSPVFLHSFVNATGVPVELHQTDGSIGAALGAGAGSGAYSDPAAAFSSRKPVMLVEPKAVAHFDELYEEWKIRLADQLEKMAEVTVES